jgi:hypothetical protein
MKRILPSQQVEKQFMNLAGEWAPLSEAVRWPPNSCSRKAVELEVSDFLGRGHYERSSQKSCKATAMAPKPWECRLAKASWN